MTDLPRPRDDLAGFTAYKTQQMAADVRLQANEWAEPNPASAWLDPEELRAVLLNRYPSHADSLAVRSALAERWKVDPDQLILGNGSNEVLLNTFLVFGGHGRGTLVFEPTYSMHGRLTTIAGGAVLQEKIGLPYEITLERALAAVARTRPHIVVFTSPNNPTGNATSDEVILGVAKAHPRTLVLLDEAYSDFAGRTLLPALPAHPNLIISKTFSKVRAAAGLRVGVLVVHREMSDVFNAVQLPYNVSALTHLVAGKIARDDAQIARRVEQCRRERERVLAALAGIPAIDSYPSVTNFVLLKVKDGDSAGTHARFLEQRVLLRDVSAWPGCEGCLRVTIGTPAENDRFISALDHVFGAVRA